MYGVQCIILLKKTNGEWWWMLRETHQHWMRRLCPSSEALDTLGFAYYSLYY